VACYSWALPGEAYIPAFLRCRPIHLRWRTFLLRSHHLQYPGLHLAHLGQLKEEGLLDDVHSWFFYWRHMLMLQ